MNKHTPGPWVVDAEGYVFQAENRIRAIPLISPWIEDAFATGESLRGEALANMALIAAAPDLLAALKEFPGFADDALIGDAWIEKMRAAIAKAEGR